MSAQRDADIEIDKRIAKAAKMYAESPEDFFFHSVGLIIGISKEEVAKRFKAIVESAS